MGYFNELLKKNNIEKHDGRVLWKYNLNETDYINLKEELKQINNYRIDRRDVALYFALWWQFGYDGGKVSKQQVVNSIGNENFTAEYFFEIAKKGGERLGYQWIQISNRLYLRTLLLQGGLPIKHMLNPQVSGSYINFIKKLIENEYTIIDEFENDEQIIKLLPQSSRNSDIYESCLNIVKAIENNDDSGYINMLNSTVAGRNLTKEIKAKIDRKNIKHHLKASWILLKNNSNYKIQLEFNFPNKIQEDELKEKLGENDLDSSYHILVNDNHICTYNKTSNGYYKLKQYIYHIDWDGKEEEINSYYQSSLKKSNFDLRVANYQKISEPTLWIELIEKEKWKLLKGKNSHTKEAFVLATSEWESDNISSYESFELINNNFNFYKLTDKENIFTKGDNIQLKYKTNVTFFDWNLNTNSPDWVVKSNLPIVTSKPNIHVYDKTDKLITNECKFSWRKSGFLPWNEWDKKLDTGKIEYKITYNDIIEIGTFYNIGDLRLKYSNEEVNSGEISIINKTNLTVNIIDENRKYSNKVINSNKYKVCLNEQYKFIKSIKMHIVDNRQKSLILEVASPFQHIKIVNLENKILDDKETIVLDNLLDYKIYTPNNNHNYYIRFSNTVKRLNANEIINNNRNQNPKYIRIVKKLLSGVNYLHTHNKIIQEVLFLYDTMNLNNSVTVELLELFPNQERNREKIIQTIFISNHNKTISFSYNEISKIELKINDYSNEQLKLLAIPLECELEQIAPIYLIQQKEYINFPDDINTGKYLIVSDNDGESRYKLLPTFIDLSEDDFNAYNISKEERIRNKSEIFYSPSMHDVEWQNFLRYYKLCLQYNIPFSAFDYIRAVFYKPELIAKAFSFLALYITDDDFISQQIPQIENDLGFSFHWIPKKYWLDAIEWIMKVIDDKDIQSVVPLIRNMQINLINNNEPYDYYKILANYIIFDKDIKRNNGNLSEGDKWNDIIEKLEKFHLNTDINKMRHKLGERIINELPTQTPSINENYHDIIPVNNSNFVVKLLLKTPLAIALTIQGNEDSIWNKNNDELIRRNMRYAQFIAPKWYIEAVIYSIKKLNKKDEF